MYELKKITSKAIAYLTTVICLLILGVNMALANNSSQLRIDHIFQQAYLKASNGGTIDRLGQSIAVSGDTMVVGAVFEDSSTTGVNSTSNNSASSSGAAYVFVRDAVTNTWSEQAYLKASNTGADDRFGTSVAISGDTLVVGAIFEESSTTGVDSTPDNLASNAGAAYVFVRDTVTNTWSQQAYLKAFNSQPGDEFGFSVAISGDTVVVTAHKEDSSTTGVDSMPDESATDAGAAYVFIRDVATNTWSEQAYLKASNTDTDDQFGSSIVMSDNTIVVGAISEDSSTTGVDSMPDNSSFAAGAAYVFVRDAATDIWNEQAYLKASNTDASDEFGFSIAVSGNTIVVGAHNEDSSTTGVDSMPDNSATLAGAAYVFTRDTMTDLWSQQAYLKASNTEALDNFGTSVAVSGNLVIVGAIGEDSSTTGVNSTADESASSAGAAYVFIHDEVTNIWSEQSYLKASNTGTNDQFGKSAGISGTTIVVGAGEEDSATGAAYIFSVVPDLMFLDGFE